MNLNGDEVMERLVSFLQNELGLEIDTSDIDYDSTELNLDSIDTVQLIFFLEKTFEISVPSFSITTQNFSNLKSLVALVMECKDQ